MHRDPFQTPVRIAALLAILAVTILPSASSMPRLMDGYNAHPGSVVQNRDKCVICHVRADGSGPLTSFGEKYDRAGLEFTPELIQEYPNLFQVQAALAPAKGAAAPQGAKKGSAPAKAAAPAAATAAPASEAPTSEGVPVVPGNEPFEAAQYYKSECRKCHGKYGDGDPLQGVPAFATKKWIDERGSKTDELLYIILKGKDKMVGQEGRINEEQALQLLHLIRSIATQYS